MSNLFPLRHTVGELRALNNFRPRVKTPRFNYLANYDLAEKVIRRLPIKRNAELLVQDGNPGVSALSTEISRHLRPRQHLILETQQLSRSYCERNFANAKGCAFDGLYFWNPEQIRKYVPDFTLPQEHSLNELHPSCFIVTNTGSRRLNADQYMQHTANTIGYRAYLQKLGRIPLLVWLPQKSAVRCIQDIGLGDLTKLPVELRILAHMEVLLCPHSFLSASRSSIKHPTIGFVENDDFVYNRQGEPPVLLLIEPRDDVLARDNLEFFTLDYMLRKLASTPKQPLSVTITYLCSGAENLVPLLKDVVDVDKPVGTLSVDELVAVARKFTEWPFRPRFLAEQPSESVRDGHAALNDSLYKAEGGFGQSYGP